MRIRESKHNYIAKNVNKLLKQREREREEERESGREGGKEMEGGEREK